MELIVTQEKVWEVQKERYGNPRLLVILMVGVKWQKAQTEKIKMLPKLKNEVSKSN